MSPNSDITDHRRIVEALFEAFMDTWRTGWHSVVLVCYLRSIQPNGFGRAVVDALIKALEEQRKISLAGTSSSLGLLHCQAIDVSSLGTWPALKSRLAPLPFRGGLLFDGGFQQEAEKADKEEEQLKKLVPTPPREEGRLGSHLRAALEPISTPRLRGLPLLPNASK